MSSPQETASPSRTPSRTFLGTPKLPARYAALVMPLLLSLLMTFVVSLISTLRSIGPVPGFPMIWLSAWCLSWMVAFPTLLLVMPVVRRLTGALVEGP